MGVGSADDAGNRRDWLCASRRLPRVRACSGIGAAVRVSTRAHTVTAACARAAGAGAIDRTWTRRIGCGDPRRGRHGCALPNASLDPAHAVILDVAAMLVDSSSSSAHCRRRRRCPCSGGPRCAALSRRRTAAWMACASTGTSSLFRPRCRACSAPASACFAMARAAGCRGERFRSLNFDVDCEMW